MAFYTTAICLLGHMTHLALESQLSVISLAPLFGTSYIEVYRPLIVPTLFAFALFGFLWKRVISSISMWLQIATVAYSSIGILLSRQVGSISGELLGPWYGPFAVEAIAFYPIVIGTASIMAGVLNSKAAKSPINSSASGTRIALISLAAARLFIILEGRVLGRILGPIVFSKYPSAWSAMRKIQATNLAATFAVAMLSSPRKIILPIMVALAAMQLSDYSSLSLAASNNVLGSTVSVSGYLSVVSVPSKSLLVLRNDHSLLGGEYISPPPQIADQLPPNSEWAPEPIFAAFVMQESIRLVTPPPVGANYKNNVLIIGLGIGTAATAMINHNVSTDVVEFDFEVVRFAVEHFQFPIDRARVTICDARKHMRSLVQQAIEGGIREYDYIIHDIFTGGVVSPRLFTSEMWQDTRRIMAPDGVLVVNFGGDLDSSVSRAMIRTLIQEFRETGGNCRAFRELPKPENLAPGDSDMANVVLFCRKREGGPVKFRGPVEEDYLKSLVRYQALIVKNEIELPIYLRDSEELPENMNEIRIINDSNVHRFGRQAAEGAAKHWELMNEVLDWRIWANW
ncbi:hypothetical protein POJ06DRAFT_48099 [Lipomyces tetrasporus]|uniref:PABS domain-containing protein n=1 Tax=Lipomyces tetrasporus TaxID=54092 RepID=A0AAD7QJV8_9ASCO|nr:uncharacterized protein POJ06DRAFT_48099 [Lipomyces tetrasporus]KAJ8096530.1 hypothetical protein POJ06DRAFT_48099 [Lipomyces tetrasporus]